jgi:hypothetical protein
LRFLTQRRLIALSAAPGTLTPAIAKAYAVHPAGDGIAVVANARTTAQELVGTLVGTHSDNEVETGEIVNESDNTLVRLINSLISEAITQRASDIHIETEPPPPRGAGALSDRWRAAALPGAASTLSFCHGGTYQNHGQHGHLRAP